MAQLGEASPAADDPDASRRAYFAAAQRKYKQKMKESDPDK